MDGMTAFPTVEYREHGPYAENGPSSTTDVSGI